MSSLIDYPIISYLKRFGIPVFVVYATYKFINHMSRRNKKAGLMGKVVVITGASSGIGEALAHAFYDYGSKVVLAARRESELNRVKQDLLSKQKDKKFPEPVVLKIDLSDLDSLDVFVKKIHELCGDIDILINNGGISHRDSVLKTEIDVYKEIMFTNYFGSVMLTKAVLPSMIKKQSGHIVFVSSVQGLIAVPERSAYASSKHALQAFADSLRAEVHQHKIAVTTISPGYVRTNVSLNALTGSGKKHGVMDKETNEGFTPEYCAMKIVDAVVDKKKELIISQFLIRLAVGIRHYAPSIFHIFTAKRAKKTVVSDL